MAVRHVTIHECDLCGAHVQPAQLIKVSVGFDKFGACGECTTRVRLLLEDIMAAQTEEEQD